jgi:hypothetical protein
MIDIPQGIPSQIIDLAEKNVEQARGHSWASPALHRRLQTRRRLSRERQGYDGQGHVICRKQRQRSLRPGKSSSAPRT